MDRNTQCAQELVLYVYVSNATHLQDLLAVLHAVPITLHNHAIASLDQKAMYCFIVKGPAAV
jgi:hypothetical protein